MQTRKPNRLKYYDYSNAGWYYVTICTKDQVDHFGNVHNEKMILNDAGRIGDRCWNKIETLHKNVELDYYVIMPNHIHGIIVINDVGDANFASPTPDRTKMELCKLIQQFKRAVSLQIKSMNLKQNFCWQRSFYERIIRNENELFNIRRYIEQNSLKWELDKGSENLAL